MDDQLAEIATKKESKNKISGLLNVAAFSTTKISRE
jgi:hypothetical protein